MKTAAVLAAAALLAAGCAERKEETKPLPPAVSLGDPGGLPPAMGMPSGHPTVVDPHAGMDMGGGVAVPPPPNVADDRFPAPEGWQSERPSSALRVAQFRLPRADGDPSDGEVAVFGSPMGDVKSNIERWRGQFTEVAHGKDALEEVTEGLKGKLHLLDITGRYSAGMGAMGAPHASAEEGAETRMIGAIYEGQGSTFYVKVLGPPGTVAKWESSIRDFILAAARK